MFVQYEHLTWQIQF